jgi:hypothetical protein
MTDDDKNEVVHLNEVVRMADPSRRSFIRSVLASGVFAAPVITTFTVSGVLLGSDEADAHPHRSF